jgi:hypothetical protein
MGGGVIAQKRRKIRGLLAIYPVLNERFSHHSPVGFLQQSVQLALIFFD